MNLRTLALPLSVVVLVSLGLAGCSGGSVEVAESTSQTASASGASAPASAAAQASETAAVVLPAKHQWVAAKKAKVQFAVPSAWEVVDADQVAAGVDSINADTKKAFTAIAEAQGMTVDVFFKQVFQQMDLYAASPTKSKDLYDNVNVTRPQVPSLPTRDAVAKDLEPLGGKVVSGAKITTLAGEGTRVAYTFPVGDRALNAEMVFVDNGSDIVQITVTAGSAAAAKALTDTVVSTVSPS